MADARRGKQKRKQRLKDEREKPSKEEYAVGKFLRFHESLNKDGKFLGNNSHYFLGSKAVDVLLESTWATKSGKKDPLFTTRTSCEAYLERLLEKGFFFRVQKFEKRDKKKRLKENTEKKIIKDDSLPSKKSDKKSKKDKEELETDKERDLEVNDGKEKDGKTDKLKEEPLSEDRKRRKKRAKLEMHDLQAFIDGPELYVWMYDPVPAKTFIIGLLLVLGAIGVCLFPLWPPEVRLGVYYLSIAAACFVGIIISLCIVRIILFAAVWVATFGKVCFWLLPNLTEDVGFFESFRPLYKYDLNNKTTDELKTEGVDDENQNEENPEQNKLDVEIAANEKEIDNLDECDVENDYELKVSEVKSKDFDEDDDDDDDDGDSDSNRGRGFGEIEDDEDEGRVSGSSSNDNGYEMIDAHEIESVGLSNYDGVQDATKEKSIVRHRKLKKTLRKE